MIYLKWLVLALIDWALLLTVPLAAPVVAAITRADEYHDNGYSWGWLWGTYDNPPQGDEGFVSKRALFLGATTGWKGYCNRVHWMIRNPLYGYAKLVCVKWEPTYTVSVQGNENISDKRKIPGWLFALARNDDGKVVAFEFYLVAPWGKSRDLRMRLGWKITTSKVHEYGFAQLVNSINPLDGYGK